MTVQLEARNASLAVLADLLRDQNSRKIDVVAPSSAISSRDGLIVVKDTEPDLTEDGVTLTAGTYAPTDVFLGGVASRLDVPTAYLRRIHADRPDLFDQTVNRLLHGASIIRADAPRIDYPADERSHLVRAFRGDNGTGVARAFLSNAYGAVDNWDVLFAALEGVRASGVETEVVGADLSERRMVVKMAAPSVAALAPELLRGYRSPFSGQQGADNPTVFAGFVISNSETGSGKWAITPRLTVQVCSNGMVITKDAFSGVHLGARLEKGVVQWSAATQHQNVELIKSQVQDTAATFLDVDYVRAAVAKLTEKAGTPVTKPEETVKVVAKRSGYTEAQAEGILAHFIKGGQLTAGGVMQAVTAFAQEVDSPDDAYELEGSAVAAMELAASLAA
jgi:hypothetical protein